MIRARKFSKPFDLCHSIMFDEFPAEYTKTIGVPGNYVKKINRRVHLKDGTGGEMDSAYIAEPDYKILFEKVAVGLEHQSVPVDEDKLNKFGDYDIQLVVDEHLPTLLVVASHLDENKSRNELIRSPSDITRILFLNLDEDNISQRLSMVNRIIYNNQYLSREITLNLGVIALYAPRKKASEIMETVLNLYLTIIDDLDLKMEYTLYSVFRVLIDAFFDDENEYRRLIKMIDEKTSRESQVRFASHESTIQSLNYAEETKEDLANAKEDLTHTKEDLANAKEDLTHTKEDLANAKEDLANAKEDLANANGKILKLENEVKRLTEQLNEK